MAIKTKHRTVILFSSAIIAMVIISTLVGYGLYIQWKEDTFAVDYRNSMYKLTADIFKKDIEIYNVKTEFENGASSLPKILMLEGKLKNNSPKTITSIMLEVSFSRPDGYVVYKDWFHPLGEGVLSGSPFFSSIKRTRDVLRPGENMSFRHLLRNCPPEVISQIFKKTLFAKSGSEGEIKLIITVSGVSVS